MAVSGPQAQFHRIAEHDRAPVSFTIDGAPATALEGDTLLTALLTNGRVLRRHEFGGEARAGFCVMGACQDCWVMLGDGMRARACTTPVVDGMAVIVAADTAHDG